MQSTWDQPNHENEKSEPQATHTKNFIRQIGPLVQIGKFDQDNIKVTFSITCDDQSKAQNLALELSGTKRCPKRKNIFLFRKLQSHPWQGTVLLEDTSSSNKHLITIFIQKSSEQSDKPFELSFQIIYSDLPSNLMKQTQFMKVLRTAQADGENYD